MDTNSMRRTRVPRYADGTEVKAGDSIRYQQAPGGILAPSGEWKQGDAAVFPHTPAERERMDAYNEKVGYIALDPDELYLRTEVPSGRGTRTAHYGIYGHIIERVSA